MIERIQAETKQRVPAKSARRQANGGRPWFLGPPPLFPGEDRAAYDELLSKIMRAVDAHDILEEVWICQIVDLEWESLCLRRWIARIVSADVNKAMYDRLFNAFAEEVIEPDEDDPHAGSVQMISPRCEELYERWIARDKAALKEVDALMASTGTTVEGLAAEAYEENLDTIERFNRQIIACEARRDAALREIYRHRTTLALTLREAVQQIEDSHYKAIETERPARVRLA